MNTQNAAIYCRISRDADGEGEGVERQKSLCRDLAQKLKLNVIKIYTDNDIGASSRTGNKPRHQYQQMLNDARQGLFSHILAYSNSRLTRRPAEWIELIELANSGKIQIRTVASGTYNLETADGRAIALTVAAWDSAEAERIAERQEVTYLDNAMRGKPKIHKQRPFGWEKDAITLRPKEAQLIREAVELIKQGASITQICRDWEKRGIKTSADRTTWEWVTMKRVLLGWRTAGISTYKREALKDNNGQYIKGQWEAIISLEDREEALTQLKKRGLKKQRQGKWLLSGLVTCAECGGKMYGQLTGTPTYACKPGKGHNVITARHLEDWVQAFLADHITQRMQDDKSKTEQTEQVEPWPYEEKLQTAITKKQELFEAYDNGILLGEDVFPKINKLDIEIKDLTRERTEYNAQQSQTPIDLSGFENILDWVLDNVDIKDDDPNQAKKELLLRNEIETIIVKKGTRGRAGWGFENAYDRIECVWRTHT